MEVITHYVIAKMLLLLLLLLQMPTPAKSEIDFIN
jgi:hypothetical protein